MNYLSKMLEVQEAVDAVRIDSPRHVVYLDKEDYEKKSRKVNDTRGLIAASNISGEDKDMFLDLVERYNDNLQATYAKKDGSYIGKDALKYILVALLSGGVGFGLGWRAKEAYEGYKGNRVKEIIEMVKREMEKVEKSE